MDTRTALVTGGSRGIGRAICLELARKGYKVIINYVSNEEKALETLSLIREAGAEGELLRFDVGNREETSAALSSWAESHKGEYISVLVNNAGVRRDNLLVWMDGEDWDKVLGTSLGGFYNVTRPLVKPMILNKWGRIINIASLSGLKGLPGQCNYSAAKGGMIAATKALAQEIARKGVTVNAVAPGFIRTDMVEGLDEAELTRHIPAGLFGEPKDVAALVGFLASDAAAYINGQVIGVNGGLY